MSKFEEFWQVYSEEERTKFDTTDESIKEYVKDGWNAGIIEAMAELIRQDKENNINL